MTYSSANVTESGVETRGVILSREYIMETLSIYKLEYIYLDSASWDAQGVTGWFTIEHYPFTKEEHIEYVTTSMLMLYLSQLGYIYARILCENNMLPSNLNITTSEFFRIRDKGNIVFFSLDNVKLRRKIFISESPLEIRMKVERTHSLGTGIIGDISFIVGGGRYTGRTKVAIIYEKD